jgi:hypothetical protein
MAGGLSMDMGLGTSVFTQGYPSAATPAAANASPQGPTTIGQKAFGIVTGNQGSPRTSFYALVGSGAFALVALAFMWWSLPRLGRSE